MHWSDMNLNQTPHVPPLRASHGTSTLSHTDKIYRVISGFDCVYSIIQMALVDPNDYTFATTTWGEPQPYGHGRDCTGVVHGCAKGKASVDFTGTGFALLADVSILVVLLKCHT